MAARKRSREGKLAVGLEDGKGEAAEPVSSTGVTGCGGWAIAPDTSRHIETHHFRGVMSAAC
jgi:hypothetical protein